MKLFSMKFFSKYKKRIVSITIIVTALFLISFPMLTNLFVVNEPPFWKVNDENDWIGFFSSYFGAIFGGIIAGFFTYWGVKLTIQDQNQTRQEQVKIDNRPQIHISEVYDADFDLQNIPIAQRKGRLVITENYRIAENRNMTDASYNFIVIENLGPGVAINCNITTGIKFELSQEMKLQNIILPTLSLDDRVFIPVDPIPDTNIYRIVLVKVEFETTMGECMYIERKYEMLGSDYVVTDSYYLKNKDGEYKEIYKINGSKAEWKFL